MALPVFIGYDDREHEAYEVCRYSIITRTMSNVDIVPIKHMAMRQSGMFNRPWRIDEQGRYWDERDGKPFSTQFSHARFAAPFLAKNAQHKGWLLFMDCASLVLDDIDSLFRLADPHYAVMCVQHLHEPRDGVKMDGQLQQRYRRKNWSSLFLWNLDHPANDRLTLDHVNNKPGAWLHAFSWLANDEIGALPEEWNYLVGHTVLGHNVLPKIVHYTTGGPWFPDMQDVPYGDLWIAEKRRMLHPPFTALNKLRERHETETAVYRA